MALLEVHVIGSEAVVLALRSAGLLNPTLVADDRPAADPLTRLDKLWAERTPAAVVVQGDTALSLAGALAACWRRIPVVHLDAGLRSTDPLAPTEADPLAPTEADPLAPTEADPLAPTEADRRLITQVAALHLAPTPLAAMNLLDEGIATADVLITGSLQPFENATDPNDDDGLAASRAAQAIAALLGLAERPDPMPGAPAMLGRQP